MDFYVLPDTAIDAEFIFHFTHLSGQPWNQERKSRFPVEICGKIPAVFPQFSRSFLT